jgi:heme-degrading monooxygenase HmoA
MIRSVLALQAKPGSAQAVEELYRERGVIDRAVQFRGCRGAVLLRSADDGPDTHLVIADWDDTDAYARWVADPWRAAVSADLAQLLVTAPDAPVVARLFEPALSPSPAPLTPQEPS